ncbi:GTP-binding protein [Sulfidibacter corallicola]|uniref:GTP-binding protein n=1 Tax=Sulfidibacter corallicola TaxID=2818388 RepID=A0A8A4TZ71_SULCO|nr:GTP-binding protein [Sulfidibacter corallicola]QTD54242.1 GTP-binding protein [Sulfidibacter corallicola]
MIPVTILSGFLGSGKTTLLNHLLKQPHEERIGVLVNDFGSIDIDGDLVVGVTGETLKLSGGCICCTIRDDLEQVVFDLLSSEDPPQRLVIEASGVSDPTSVAMTFFVGRLKNLCRVETLVTLIDSETFFQTPVNLTHLLERQLYVADLIVLNKSDLCPSEKLDAVSTLIRSEFPRARIIRTRHGEVPLELLFERSESDFSPEQAQDPIESHVHTVHDHHHHHHTPHTLIFETWSFTCDHPLDRERLFDVLSRLSSQVYRAKGFVHAQDVPSREIVFHVAGKRVNQSIGNPWGARAPQTRLVFIAEKGHCFDELKDQLQECTSLKKRTTFEKPAGADAWLERFASRVRARY